MSKTVTPEQFQNSKLDKISHEVNEFHPLLKSLLPKLPDVTEVEYRHGSQEMGADFVMEIVGGPLRQPEYVGVIAKVGDINSSKVSEISTQLRQCRVPRTFRGGKQTVTLSRFWVMTTGKIQENAQREISNEFASQSINWIPQYKLRDLISEHQASFWTDVPLEIANKLAATKEAVTSLDRTLTILPPECADIYITQRLVRNKGKIKESKRWRDKPEEVDLVDFAKAHRKVFIEAEYGFGKSKLLRKTVSLLTEPTGYERHSIIPHYAHFWRFVEKFGSSLDAFLEADGYTPDLFKDKLKHIVFFDGFDETHLSAEEQEKALQDLISQLEATPDVNVVFATRPLGSGFRGALTASGCEFLDLQQLSFQQVVSFLTTICTTLAPQNRLMTDIKNSPLYQDLPRSPISAILLARLLEQNHQELPSNMTELYAKYTELMMGRWDQGKGLKTEQEYKATTNILLNLSGYFIDNQLNSIAEDEAYEFFKSYILARGNNESINIDELFKRCLGRSGLLVRNPLDNTVMFKHQSFAEYLYAYRQRNKGGFEIDQRVLHPYWSNVYYFYFGLRLDCEDIIDKLLSVDLTHEGERWGLVLNYPNYLLAACETPYYKISEVFKFAIMEFIKLYDDVAEGKIDSCLASLTKMQFLSISAHMFHAKYGYRFFQTALEECVTDPNVVEKLSPRNRCSLMFFLGFARLGFEDPKLLDFMIRGDMDDMPTEMKLVVAYETKKLGCRSSIVKKFAKRITKEVTSNPKSKGVVDRIYNTPLSRVIDVKSKPM